MKRLILSLLLSAAAVIAPVTDIYAASTVTTTSRVLNSGNSQSFSISNANLGSLNAQDTDFTISMWVYPTTLSGVKAYAGAWAGTGNYLLYSNGTTLSWSVQNPSGTNATVSMVSASTSTWYHMVGTHSAGSDVIEFYVNGVSQGTTSLTGGARSISGSFFLGSDDLGRFMDGRLQSGGFWTRVLTSSQVSELYNSGTPKQFRELSSNLNDAYVFWDLAETNGTAYNATSTTSKNLTNNNAIGSAAGKISYTAEDASDFTAASSQYLSISNASQVGLDPGANNSWYMGFWLRLDGYGSFPILVGKGTNVTGWHLYLDGAGGTISFVDRANSQTTVQGGSIGLNTWVYCESYYNATTDKLGTGYNLSVTEVTDTVGPATSSEAFVISRYTPGSNYFDGRMANLVFISGVPTAAERSALFNRGFGVHYSDRPILSSATYVSWWPMTESSGTRVDVIGPNNLSDNGGVAGAAGIVYDAPNASARNRIRIIT